MIREERNVDGDIFLDYEIQGDQLSRPALDALAATQFVFSCIRQDILSPQMLSKIELRLRELAEQNVGEFSLDRETTVQKAELAKLTLDLEATKRLKSIIVDEAQSATVAALASELQERYDRLQNEIALNVAQRPIDIGAEIARAFSLVKHQSKLANEKESMAGVARLFQALNVRLFFKFAATKPRRRVVNKIVGGVIVFGTALRR